MPYLVRYEIDDDDWRALGRTRSPGRVRPR